MMDGGLQLRIGLLPRISNELLGGLTAAVVSIPGNILFGLIAFGPLGDRYVGVGIAAAMISSIVISLSTALIGGMPAVVSGPKGPTALIFASLLTRFAVLPGIAESSPTDVQSILSLTFFVIFLSGLMQLLLGTARLGNLIKFIPYPVTAGILNGTAIIIIVGQLGDLIGAPDALTPATVVPALRAALPLNIVVGAVSGVTMIAVQRVSRKLPGSLIGLLAGTGLYFLLGRLGFGHLLGPTVGAVPATFVVPSHLPVFFSVSTVRLVVASASFVIPAVLSIAVLESMDSLFATQAMENNLLVRPRANRELVGQGLGNLISACLGGLSGSGFVGRSQANFESGGRTRLSVVFCSLFLTLVLFFLLPLLGKIPAAATAGIIMVIGFKILDRWSFRSLKSLATDRQARSRSHVTNTALVFVVSLLALVFNLAIAVVFGIALAMLLFLIGQGRSIVRRTHSGSSLQSLKQRNAVSARYLAEQGYRLAVLELEGALFFGSADLLADRITDISSLGSDFIILDMKRVTEIDSTGARVLRQMYTRLTREGKTLAISYLGEKTAITSFLKTVDAGELLNSVKLFPDTDLALEYYENRILDDLYNEGWESREFPIRDFEVLKDLSEQEVEVFLGYLSRQKFEKGERIFSQNDDSESLYLIEKGTADVIIETGGGTPKRLHSLSVGTIFGELALLDRQPRSAHVVAAESLVCHSLNIDDFERMKTSHPRLAFSFLSGISRVIAVRLRSANQMISYLES